MPRQCKFFQECHHTAVISIPYARLFLCADHFRHYIESRIQKTIEKYHMINPTANEKILLALSGGKDSQVLLTILHQLFGDSVAFLGVYIDLGIRKDQYSIDSERYAADLCNSFNIPFSVINVKQDFGLDIDDVAQLRKDFLKYKISMGNERFKGICSYCGAIKRYALNKFAVDHGCSKVATGHNLTDEYTSLMTNFFNMDPHFLARHSPITNSNHDNLIPRIKPLYYTSEWEVMMYTYYTQIPHVAAECEYSTLSPNIHIKKILQEFEKDRPGIMIGLLRRYRKLMLPIIIASLPPQKRKYDRRCIQCQMPTSRPKCAFCRTTQNLLDRMRQIQKLKQPKATQNEKPSLPSSPIESGNTNPSLTEMIDPVNLVNDILAVISSQETSNRANRGESESIDNFDIMDEPDTVDDYDIQNDLDAMEDVPDLDDLPDEANPNNQEDLKNAESPEDQENDENLENQDK
jgi:uncharacterized protein (TIGR00269 family)